jgi:hypothetical protein
LEFLWSESFVTSEPGKARSLRLKDMAQAVRRAVVEIPLFGSIPAGFGAGDFSPFRHITRCSRPVHEVNTRRFRQLPEKIVAQPLDQRLRIRPKTLPLRLHGLAFPQGQYHMIDKRGRTY